MLWLLFIVVTAVSLLSPTPSSIWYSHLLFLTTEVQCFSQEYVFVLCPALHTEP